MESKCVGQRVSFRAENIQSAWSLFRPKTRVTVMKEVGVCGGQAKRSAPFRGSTRWPVQDAARRRIIGSALPLFARAVCDRLCNPDPSASLPF
jgi:hypothetical protein